MKKVMVILLTVMIFLSFMTSAVALTESQQQILKHYEEVMSGKWQLLQTGNTKEVTFDSNLLLITGDHRVFYNQYDKALDFVSGRLGYALGEVLLSNDPSIIVLKYPDKEGHERFVYYQKID